MPMMKDHFRASWAVLTALLLVLSAPPASNASVTFQHDPSGKLTRATYSDGTVVDYHYDANGNRTGAIVTPPSDSSAPSVPTNLQATPVSQTQMDLQWTPSTDNLGVAGYRIERCTGVSCTSYSQIAEWTDSSYPDTGLSGNTTYVYRVRAFDAANNQSGYSTNVSARTPDATAPTIPGAPTLTNITMISAQASWTAATDENGIAGYEYRLNSNNWQTLGNVLSVSLSGLSPWTTYNMQVRARDTSNNLGAASSSVFRTLDTSPPGPPGTPTIQNVTMGSASVTWTAASDNVGVIAYEYRLNNGAWLSVASNVLGVNLSGLSAATQYQFQVRASDEADNAGPAASATFTTLDTQAPTVPTGLTVSAPASGTVNLNWAPASDNVAVTGYKIYRNGAHIGSKATPPYADNTTSGTTAYAYRVSAYDNAGNESAQSAPASVTTPDTIAPSTPTNLQAVAASASRVDLSWNHAADQGGSGRAGYRIYRGGAHIATTAANTFGDTSVASGTSYSYTVTAFDGAGNASGHSNIASATTPVPLQASVNSTTWSWFSQIGQPPQIFPSFITVTASGGAGGYSYAWQYVSGDTQTSVSSPTANSTRWTRTISNYHVDYTSVWRCAVSDSSGNTTYTPNVTVTLRAENLDRARQGVRHERVSR
jgi:YD repeat-containing protein